VSPRPYLTLGASGKFNHLVGVRRVGTVLAVNTDPQAPVFDGADIGIVGDWGEAAAAHRGRGPRAGPRERSRGRRSAAPASPFGSVDVRSFWEQ
jgi:hypothetical protein